MCDCIRLDQLGGSECVAFLDSLSAMLIQPRGELNGDHDRTLWVLNAELGASLGTEWDLCLVLEWC